LDAVDIGLEANLIGKMQPLNDSQNQARPIYVAGNNLGQLITSFIS
jgi:hypothetical protein